MDGLPLLSGTPPDPLNLNEDSCRRCNKDFHFFTRTKKCNHCGYLYCSSCADFQALRQRSGSDAGYESVPVCAYCMEMLSITSSGKNKLRSLPISKLRTYMKAYNIRASGAAVEKDDLVEAILRSKNNNGCLYSIHEDYYRRNSVPQGSSDRSRAKNFFSRSTREANSSSHPSYTPRQPGDNYQTQQTSNNIPSSTSSYPQASSSATNNRPSSNRQSHSQPNAQTNTNAQTNFNAQYNRNPYGTNGNAFSYASQSNLHNRSQPPSQTSQPRRPRSASSSAPSSSTPAPSRPPPQVPTLNELLEKDKDEIMHLPISTLKAILFNNRVNASVGILEKEDLVRKVIALVTDERRDREIKQQEELFEEAQRMEQVRSEDTEEHLDHTSAADEARSSQGEESMHPSSDSADASKQHKLYVPDIPSSHEGLCVVCQDEHANMAIIDCGHLALCKSCSELVMKTSRECPLCRTRIVTEQRLLRIFRS